MRKGQLSQLFRREFGGAPAGAARGPGRVNLIGEHTDYNLGFVLPMAIDLEIRIAYRPSKERRICLFSQDFDERAVFDLADLTPQRSGWRAYLAGVAWAMQAEGIRLSGWDGVMTSKVPTGSGLSSSAAVELVSARVLAEVSGIEWEAARMARLAQRAENEWVGMRCGIMDQLASACGRRQHALLIDCQDVSFDLVRLPESSAVVVLDTGTRRRLTQSGYNDRRAECEAAARAMGVPSLRYAGWAELEANRGRLTSTLFRRARHVITENQRTLEAAACLQAGDLAAFGRAMNASHASLRDDYAVSTPELDRMAELAQAHSASYGARMMGGGFGGSVVCLAQSERGQDLANDVLDGYLKATGRAGKSVICSAADGASLIR